MTDASKDDPPATERRPASELEAVRRTAADLHKAPWRWKDWQRIYDEHLRQIREELGMDETH